MNSAIFFREWKERVKSVTLAPPLARLLVPHCHLLAVAAESIARLRTHQIAVLLKTRAARS